MNVPHHLEPNRKQTGSVIERVLGEDRLRRADGLGAGSGVRGRLEIPPSTVDDL
ncbi:hypothetical protein [Dermacoccus sp. PAMC28757]|uniref:hypothetical protein n=1 Tax=Dermacoccus sp. PAMC28757 TaxID=2762331 RepID=UPI0021061F91|nr:hypothetical protein [Dermacoccus sp. PAMC28757]